jgi:4-hydroxy-2-oxoheptanedioate aldolase
MMIDDVRKFKNKIAENAVIGPFSKTEDPAFIEIMGYAGMDFVILDLEHGPNNIQILQNLVRAAQIGGILPIVRVKEGIINGIGEALDIGAGGVSVPQITNPDEAARVIRAARFAPDGNRGVCRFVRAAKYSSTDRFQYFRESNEMVIILQIEGEEALSNLDDILAVPGFDILFIGPYDLSQSIGYPGQIDHPEVINRMKHIVKKSIESNIIVGTFVDTIENAKKWKEIGVRFISYSVDVGIFYESCCDLIKQVK